MLERLEAQRIADGFNGDEEPPFTHTFVHVDKHHRAPSRFLATNDESQFTGSVERDLVRKYKDLGNWEFGWGIHETEQVNGTHYGTAQIKLCIGAVPLDGLLDYYSDLDCVVTRLETAAEQLVQRWNALPVKRPLEWSDEICRHDWLGKGGKLETTIFTLRLSTYNFYLNNKDREGTAAADESIGVSDLKVLIKLRTTVNADKSGGPNKRGKTGYRNDFFGFNVHLDHYLNKLRQEGFREALALARQSTTLAAEFRAEKARQVGEEQERNLRKRGILLSSDAEEDGSPQQQRQRGGGGGYHLRGRAPQQPPRKQPRLADWRHAAVDAAQGGALQDAAGRVGDDSS